MSELIDSLHQECFKLTLIVNMCVVVLTRCLKSRNFQLRSYSKSGHRTGKREVGLQACMLLVRFDQGLIESLYENITLQGEQKQDARPQIVNTSCFVLPTFKSNVTHSSSLGMANGGSGFSWPSALFSTFSPAE